ncbi:MAG TPA: lysoplasmalogenase [Verrucomicrobiae bacterium]
MDNREGSTQTTEQSVVDPPGKCRRCDWVPALLVCIGAASGAWVLGSRSLFSTWQGFPNTASTTLLFLAGAALAGRNVPPCYKWSIVAGLGCSAIGDAFLMLPDDRFVRGLCSFLAAHLCYLWALTSDTRLAERKTPFVLCGILAVALVAWLWPGVAAPLRFPVVLYAVALLGMAAQAITRGMSKRDAGAILAAVGAALFVISDAVLAFQRFRHPLEWGRLIVLGTYFAAQGGIALSVLRYR